MTSFYDQSLILTWAFQTTVGSVVFRTACGVRNVLKKGHRKKTFWKMTHLYGWNDFPEDGISLKTA